MKKTYELSDEVETNDNNYSVISNIFVPDNKSVFASIEINAVYSNGIGGSNGDNYKAMVELQGANIGGSLAVTLLPVSLYENGTQQSGGAPVWGFDFDVTGRNLRVRVKGALNNTIHWQCFKTINLI